MEQNSYNQRLKELDGSGYQIVDEQPDIDGWSIYDQNQQKIGKVEDMLFDPELGKVRYIIANLRDNDFQLHSKKVLIPIGIAELHENDDDVIIPQVTAEQLSALPEYHKGELTESDEQEIMRIFSVGSADAITGSTLNYAETNRYDHQHFSDDNLYKNRNARKSQADEAVIPVIQEDLVIGKKEVERGGIRLKSRIVEQPVERDITLREEEVRIDRTPVDRLATAASLQSEEIEVTTQGEVPVVNKEARVVEEINVRKEVTEEEHTIRDTVRKTEVDIDRTNEEKRG